MYLIYYLILYLKIYAQFFFFFTKENERKQRNKNIIRECSHHQFEFTTENKYIIAGEQHKTPDQQAEDCQ